MDSNFDNSFEGILLSSVFEVLGAVRNGEPAYISRDYLLTRQDLSAKGVFVQKPDGSIARVEDFSPEVVGRVNQNGKLLGFDITVVPGGKTFSIPKSRYRALFEVIPFSNAHGTLPELPTRELNTEQKSTPEFVEPEISNKINLQGSDVYWDYYNPDSESGGQYVCNKFNITTVFEAVDKTSNPDEFFDFIGSVCSQELVDVDDPEFAEFDAEFRTRVHNYCECDRETMDALMKIALAVSLSDYSAYLPDNFLIWNASQRYYDSWDRKGAKHVLSQMDADYVKEKKRFEYFIETGLKYLSEEQLRVVVASQTENSVDIPSPGGWSDQNWLDLYVKNSA
jgi:hypothetical protein